MLTAISNLFGVGGASAIARALGTKDEDAARRISTLSLYGGLLSACVFSLVFFLLADPVLRLCGANQRIPTPWPTAMPVGGDDRGAVHHPEHPDCKPDPRRGQRRDGGLRRVAGRDFEHFPGPAVVLPRFLGYGAVGAGMATALSNMAAVAYFAIYLLRRRGTTYLSVNPSNLRHAGRYLRQVLSIGFPSALQYALTVVAIAAQSNLSPSIPPRRWRRWEL